MDAYNIAFRYLVAKYPQFTSKHLTESFNKQLRFKTKKAIKALMETVTDADYIVELNTHRLIDACDGEDKSMILLLGQFYCGISAKNELATHP